MRNDIDMSDLSHLREWNLTQQNDVINKQKTKNNEK